MNNIAILIFPLFTHAFDHGTCPKTQRDEVWNNLHVIKSLLEFSCVPSFPSLCSQLFLQPELLLEKTFFSSHHVKCPNRKIAEHRQHHDPSRHRCVIARDLIVVPIQETIHLERTDGRCRYFVCNLEDEVVCR